MAFRSVGINLPRLFQEGVSGIADDLEALKIAGPDFAEVWPHHLGSSSVEASMQSGRSLSESYC